MELTLTHYRLLVSNYTEVLKFYRDMLGFDMVWDDETTGYAELETGSVRLALFGRAAMAEVIGTSDLPGEVSAQDRGTIIFRVQDVDQACSDLEQKGIKLLTLPKDRVDWGIRTAHFRDPDGNLIEINAKL